MNKSICIFALFLLVASVSSQNWAGNWMFASTVAANPSFQSTNCQPTNATIVATTNTTTMTVTFSLTLPNTTDCVTTTNNMTGNVMYTLNVASNGLYASGSMGQYSLYYGNNNSIFLWINQTNSAWVLSGASTSNTSNSVFPFANNWTVVSASPNASYCNFLNASNGALNIATIGTPVVQLNISNATTFAILNTSFGTFTSTTSGFPLGYYNNNGSIFYIPYAAPGATGCEYTLNPVAVPQPSGSNGVISKVSIALMAVVAFIFMN